MSLTRNLAVLNLLFATHPELADLPVTIELTGEKDLYLQAEHGSPVNAEVAARLAKALRTEHHTSTGIRQSTGTPFVCHNVYGKFSRIGINFQGYVYPDAEQPGGAE